jgi:hypothetical protein
MVKPQPMEIVAYDDIAGITQLTEATYAVTEPGFQIDRVSNPEELTTVFDVILKATPSRADRSREYGEVTYHEHSFIPTGAHTDGEFHDLAVHLNIEETYAVTLGSTAVGYISLPPDESFPTDCAMNIRKGTVSPGRLTVFSEGGYDWLPAAIHFFERSESQVSHWARYTQHKPQTSGLRIHNTEATVKFFNLLDLIA